MLIVCPNCATSYQVEPASLGQVGRSVRCARCRNVWFATPSAAGPAMVAADDWDVIDTGPRVPSVDSPPPPAASTTFAAAPDAAKQAPDGAASLQDSPAETGSIDGIDVASLSADMAAARAVQEASADAVLAEVTGPDSVPSVQPAQPAAVEAQATPAGEDVETVAARRARQNALRRRWQLPGLSAAVVALAAANAAIVVWRTDIVRLLPQTASLYAAIGLPVNLRGLAFENVRMSRAEHDGVGVLVVEGSIVNVSGRPAEVPRLRLAVRNDSKHEVYAWTTQPPRSILGPGEALPFRSRLASPPVDARDVLVRFFTRRDVVAGLN